jgi:hypothetical protein
MANHCWRACAPGCHELKLVAIALSNGPDQQLDHAADVLVGPELEDGLCPANGMAVAAASALPVPGQR